MGAMVGVTFKYVLSYANTACMPCLDTSPTDIFIA